MKALDIVAGLVLEDGRRWGDAAAQFQWDDARAILDPGSPTPYQFLTRGRGGSKTSDLAGVVIAAMLGQLDAGSRCYALAADRDQGRLLLDAMAGFAARTPELRGALTVDAYRATAARGGSTVEVLAADAPGAWGLRPALLVVDEIAWWGSTGAPRRLWEAASSAVAKLPGARLAVLTTAGDPAHWSRKILEHARRDPLWRVNEVPGPVPWLDRDRLAEQRRRLLDSSYRRLFLNEWVSAEDRLVSDADLRACVLLDGPLPPQSGARYAIGLDVGLKRDATVAAVCHAEPVRRDVDGRIVTVAQRVVLDRLQTWQGSRLRPVDLSTVEEWLGTVAHTYNRAPIIFDPYQAIGTMQRLAARGTRTVEFTFSSASVGRIAANLHGLLRDRQLALPDDEALLDELAHVRLRETQPGVVRMDHDADRRDDRAVALALAAFHLTAQRVGSSSAESASIRFEPTQLGEQRDPGLDVPPEAAEALSGTVTLGMTF